ncbi:Mg2+ transporter MgtC family protein [Aspergillus leporis]|jgi:putative Mg2+ transporter-C (MgtC) family protein|uniref:Mg2+ transporter MgtC family protein n=1 Tax=Aspergillus leporis TaxID=41062 RepID=A0A5N5X596_9EURO|nr:Mg2+ transporter MgtC family protein [Aspergillus leporis]
MRYPFDQAQQQTWIQVGQLLVATALSSIIGIERQLKHKSAGLRTNTLVGIGAALFMLTSKFGTLDVLDRSLIVLDPSRIAAQIVSGIGFIGGGIIFKERNEIRGLTTAAGVWLSAAVGAACGAGLLRLATIATGLYIVAVIVYPSISHFLQRRLNLESGLRLNVLIRYRVEPNGLQTILQSLLDAGFTVERITRLDEVPMNGSVPGGSPSKAQSASNGREAERRPSPHLGKQSRAFDVDLILDGPSATSDLMQSLSQLNCVMSISVEDDQPRGVYTRTASV